MTITQYLNAMTLRMCGIMPAESPTEEAKRVFVNDLDDIIRQKVVEAKTWYEGDSDELANLYRVDRMFEYPTEPYYWKNRRNFFWAVAVGENEYKLTHSGFARDMVDTIVSICGTPVVKCADERDREKLERILDENGFWGTYRKIQMPMTLVCGWGAYKIDWKPQICGNVPVLTYHDALEVRFHKSGPMTVGMTYLYWYKDADGTRYLLAETRAKAGRGKTYKVIYNTFKVVNDQEISPCDGIPGIKHPRGWHDMPVPFGAPCSFYADNLHGYEGRSIYAGKIDLLDSLDQAVSQQGQADRRSGPIDVFDLDYCERDPKTKMPRLPKTFERKFIGVRGRMSADGSGTGRLPVQTTQPSMNIDMYTQEIESLKRMIIAGHLSPATMGIDVDRREGSDTLHERNKETVFTRNHLIREEAAVLKDLFTQTLMAAEFLETGAITKTDYGVSVEFDELSDVSFEGKIEALSTAYVNGAMSPEMFVDRLYGKSVSDEVREREIAYLKESRAEKRQGLEESEEGMFGDVSGDEGRLPESIEGAGQGDQGR